MARGVQGVGGADADRVELLGLEHLGEGGVGLELVLLRHLGARGLAGVGDGDDLAAG
jgi:hypothetical protein